jgi:lysine-N-methylase
MLHDVESGDVVEIGPREWVLLASADGTRDVDGVRLAATREGVEVSREALVELLDGVRQAGMLADGPAPRRAPAHAPGPKDAHAGEQAHRAHHDHAHAPPTSHDHDHDHGDEHGHAHERRDHDHDHDPTHAHGDEHAHGDKHGHAHERHDQDHDPTHAHGDEHAHGDAHAHDDEHAQGAAAGRGTVPLAERPIERLAGYGFHCDGHGTCCQLYATVVFSPLEAARARSLKPGVLDAGDRHEHAFMPERGSGPCAGSAVALVDGRCAYLDGTLCALHSAGGAGAKPLGCNLFPLALVDDGTRVRASVSVECACVLASVGKAGGAPILDVEMRVRGDLDPAVVVDELPAEVALTGEVRAPIAEYLRWSDAALEGLRESFDPALSAWGLADAIEVHGLDPARAMAAISDPPALDEARAARWLAALAEKAARRAKAQNAWRSPKDLCRRGVSIVAAAAGLLADPDVLGAVAAGAGAAPVDEDFYLRVALFGHQLVGYPLAVALRDRGVAIWVARAFPLAAEALYPGESEPAFEHPLALVEALLRGHGLRRYTDAVAVADGGVAAP